MAREHSRKRSVTIQERLIAMHLSPQSWGLAPTFDKSDRLRISPLGISRGRIENRCRENTYQWLMRQYDGDVGAFHGFYDPRTRSLADPQTANLIAPWQLLAAFDRYQDEQLLQMAKRCIDWLDGNMVDLHPMSLVIGGVQDNLKPNQLWTKYTADYVISNLGIYRRTKDENYLNRAVQSGRFLLQAQRHKFAPMYDRWRERWVDTGWQSFGRAAGAMLGIWYATKADEWLGWAMEWAEFGLHLQALNGCFYLVNDEYYNSDIAADEIRALACIGIIARRDDLSQAAVRFADWHIDHQRPNGSWLLAVDRHGVPVSEYVGPGDVSNLVIAMLLMHNLTGDLKYLTSATRGMRYALSVQALPGEQHPYSDDPNTGWGFWSWDPYFDYTMSPDQATHHVRAFWFFIDYYFTLSDQVRAELRTRSAVERVRRRPSTAEAGRETP
jgi:hypothetical protein